MYYKLICFCLAAAFVTSDSSNGVLKDMENEAVELDLFDFTSNSTNEEDIDLWYESSDTVRTPGKSKAAILLQKSRLFQRATFFAMLNPQPNGAGFAGVRRNVTEMERFQGFSGLKLTARSQGMLPNWKITLKYAGNAQNFSSFSYESQFKMTLNEESFEEVLLPFSMFKAYFRGIILPDAAPLEIEKVVSFGLQAFGGVYEDEKQSGVGVLEIDTIKVYKD